MASVIRSLLNFDLFKSTIMKIMFNLSVVMYTISVCVPEDPERDSGQQQCILIHTQHNDALSDFSYFSSVMHNNLTEVVELQ